MVVSPFTVFTIPAALAPATSATNSHYLTLPPGAVYVDPLEYNVLGANYTDWRNDTFVAYNPTDATPPVIQVFDPSFLEITGPNATIRLIASNPGYAFAHEAPIFVSDLNSVFFSSSFGSPLGYAGWYNNRVVSMLNLTEVDNALAATTGDVNIQVQPLNLPDTLQMVNGGTGPYKGNLLRHVSSRTFAPLDPAYGWLGGFRPEPMLPPQVYRLDPSTGQVQVVADKFVEPNGIAFAPDGKTAFVTDSGVVGGILGNNQTNPATIYQYDVDAETKSFINRRVFAYTDSGIPDGIQLDTNGNVFLGCGDGVQVWNPNGVLIGKFFLNSTAAELMFTKSGLLILNDEYIYIANIQAQGMDLVVP